MLNRIKAAAIEAAIEGESGHGTPALGALVAGAGTILLAVGAVNDTGWLAIAGGVISLLGFLAMQVLNHITVDYDMYRRLEALEKKDR